MTELDDAIAQALAKVGDGSAKPSAFNAEEYIAAFRDSAREKAADVLELLKAEPHFATKRPVFVSIGGGDGEEVAHLLECSPSTIGILIEMVSELANLAKERRLPSGKELHIIPKPAQTAIQEAMELATTFVRRGRGDAIVVTCHAVLHELFDRGGEEFDVVGFFAQIFPDPHIPTLLTYREPGAPEKWPDTVIVTAHCSPKSLVQLAEAITKRHPALKKPSPQPSVVGDGVRLHKNIAMELLSKLFYLPDLPHELGERVTSVEHGPLQNAIWTAIGDRARYEHLADIKTSSGPTKSFVLKWKQLKVRVDGLDAKHSRQPLAIAESQTRVVAWRIPEVSAPVTEVSQMPADIAVAREAFERADEGLLDSVLLSRGRSWIESSESAAGIKVLEEVAQKSDPVSLRSYWSKYLLCIAALFNGDYSGLTFFEKTDVRNVGLDLLFRAEQMEFLRKSSDRPAALNVANALLGQLQPGGKDDSDLRRYVLGTANFLLSNFLRFGGRYDEAIKFIEAAESCFKPGIASHATELAHCFYAKQVCVAMTGIANFSLAKTEAVQQFAGALIELSYSHAAWFVRDVDRAQDHATRAAERFQSIGKQGYSQRARSLFVTLEIWRALAAGAVPKYEGLRVELRRGIEALVTGTDLDYLKGWVSTLRPSAAVGLLQIPRQFCSHFEQPVHVTLPPILKRAANDWIWTDTPIVTLKEADSQLRQLIGIPQDRIIPLMAD